MSDTSNRAPLDFFRDVSRIAREEQAKRDRPRPASSTTPLGGAGIVENLRLFNQAANNPVFRPFMDQVRRTYDRDIAQSLVRRERPNLMGQISAPDVRMTYEQYAAWREATGRPTSFTPETYEGITERWVQANPGEVDRFPEAINAYREQYATQEQNYIDLARAFAIEDARHEQTEAVRDVQGILTGQGQHDQYTQRQWARIGTWAAAILLDEEGDDEAKPIAAHVLKEFRPQIEPHLAVAITSIDGDEDVPDRLWGDVERWTNVQSHWIERYGKRIIGDVSDTLTTIGAADAAKRLINTLDQPAQWAVHAMLGTKTMKTPFYEALGLYRINPFDEDFLNFDPDVTLERLEGADFGMILDGAAHAGSSTLRALGGLLDEGLTGGHFGIGLPGAMDDDYRLMKVAGEYVNPDVNEDGQINLREIYGIDPSFGDIGVEVAGIDIGGFAVGLADTVGLILADPLTYVGIGVVGRAKMGYRALASSNNPLARRAGTILSNGGKWANLNDDLQIAARRAFYEAMQESVDAMSDKQIRRAWNKANRGDLSRRISKKVTELDIARDNYVISQVNRIEDAIVRGGVPGIRFGGKTVVPMRKIWDFLGIIDSRLAQDSAWAWKAAQMTGLHSPYELAAWVARVKTLDEIPQSVIDQFTAVEGMGKALVDEPDTFIGRLLAQDPEWKTSWKEFREGIEPLMEAPDLQGVDDAYGRYVTIREARDQRLAARGQLSPGQLRDYVAASAKLDETWKSTGIQLATYFEDPNHVRAVKQQIKDKMSAIRDEIARVQQQTSARVRAIRDPNTIYNPGTGRTTLATLKGELASLGEELDMIDQVVANIKAVQPKHLENMMQLNRRVQAHIAEGRRSRVRPRAGETPGELENRRMRALNGEYMYTQQEERLVKAATDAAEEFEYYTTGAGAVRRAELEQSISEITEAIKKRTATIGEVQAKRDTQIAEYRREIERLRKSAHQYNVTPQMRTRYNAAKKEITRLQQVYTDKQSWYQRYQEAAQKNQRVQSRRASHLLDVIDEMEATGEPITAVAEKLIEDKVLTPAAVARVKNNLDVVNNPGRFVQDVEQVRGIRGLSIQDTFVGRMLRRASDAFSPRASLRRAQHLRTGAADAFDNHRATAAAHAHLWKDVASELGYRNDGKSALLEAAYKEAGGADKAKLIMNDWLTREVRDQSYLDDLAAFAADNPATAAAIEILDRIRTQSTKLAAASGMDEAIMLERLGYYPRQTTRDAQIYVQNLIDQSAGDATMLNAFRDLGFQIDDVSGTLQPPNPLTQGGHARARTILPDEENIDIVNNHVRKTLTDAGLNPDDVANFKLYADNPAEAFLLRYKEAQNAYIQYSMIEGLSKETTLTGRPMVYLSDHVDNNYLTELAMLGDDSAFGAGRYVEKTLPDGRKYWIDSTIQAELERTRSIMGNPMAKNRFVGAIRTMNNNWGQWATTPLLKGTGYTSRNVVGNILNMTIKGFSRPATLVDAMGIQKRMRQVVDLQRKRGLSWADAADEVFKDAPDQLRTLRLAREHGILDGSETAELFHDWDPIAKRWKDNSPIHRAISSTFDPSNAMLKYSRMLNQGIEDNQRLAMFMDGLEKGYGPEESARLVREALFDYSDLTGFEIDTVRMASRFYSWIRKNTALQLQVALQSPGRVVNTEKITQEFFSLVGQLITGEERMDVTWDEGEFGPGGIYVPEWAHSLPIFGDAQLGLETPLLSASESLSQMLNLATFWNVHAIDYVTNEFGTGYGQSNNIQTSIAEALGLTSGAPAGFVQMMYEIPTGTDIFTGAPLESRHKTVVERLSYLVSPLNPLPASIASMMEKVGALDEDRELEGELFLANAILGLQVRPDVNNPKHAQYANWAMLDSARDIIQDAVDLGYRGDTGNIPTLEELEEVGRLALEDRALQWYMYNSVAALHGGYISDDDRAEALRHINSKIREDVMIPERAEEEGEELTPEQRARNIANIIRSLENDGVQVDTNLLLKIAQQQSGMTMIEMEDIGLEPSYRNNPFLDTDDEEAQEVTVQQNRANFDELLRLLGLEGIEQAERLRPVLDRYTRKNRQMIEAGMTEEERFQELWDEDLNENQRFWLTGGVYSPPPIVHGLHDAEAMEKFNRWADEEAAKFQIVFQIAHRRLPTQQEWLEWVGNSELNKKQLEQAGIPYYRRAPRAENLTPEGVIIARNEQEIGAVIGAVDRAGVVTFPSGAFEY